MCRADEKDVKPLKEDAQTVAPVAKGSAVVTLQQAQRKHT